MLCQKFSIFVFMAAVLVRLGAAAHFDCNDATGTVVICTVTLSSNSFFQYSPDSELECCTGDYLYCVTQVIGEPGDAQWRIEVTNHGEPCSGVCNVQQQSIPRVLLGHL